MRKLFNKLFKSDNMDNEAKMITTNTGIKWTRLPEDIIEDDKDYYDNLLREAEIKVRNKFNQKKYE